MIGVVFIMSLAASAAGQGPSTGPDGAFAFGTSVGRGALPAYTSLSADCDGMVAGRGRNNAWGQWLIPLDGVEAEPLPAREHQPGPNAYGLVFRCLDGACIVTGKPQRDPAGAVTEHEVYFNSREHAEEVLANLARLKVSCQARTERQAPSVRP